MHWILLKDLLKDLDLDLFNVGLLAKLVSRHSSSTVRVAADVTPS